MGDLRVRSGSVADLDAVLHLFDDNVAWLAARGRPQQWGTDPWSRSPQRRAMVRGLLENGTSQLRTRASEVLGVSIVSDSPMPYVPAVSEPERYVQLLMTSPQVRGEGLGARLLTAAKASAVEDGIGLVRVDCWAGGDRSLVAYYEGQGFVPVLEVEARPGATVQVLAWRPR